jgi:Uma2 family endonuclease
MNTMLDDTETAVETVSGGASKLQARLRPPQTLAEYLAMSEGAPYFQFINGTPALMPSSSLFHQRVLGELYTLFRAFVKRYKLGDVYFAPLDVYLSEQEYYQPDLIFISNE